MDIAFRNRGLEKAFNGAIALRRIYGERMAKEIIARLLVLESAPNLAAVPSRPPARRHQLSGDRRGQFAVDLVHPRRLVFRPDHDPVPHTDDRGIDLERVTAIMILDVIDYH